MIEIDIMTEIKTLTGDLSGMTIFKKLTKKQKDIDTLFKPDDNGVSVWVKKEDIDKFDTLKWGNNGVIRHGNFHDSRYRWEKFEVKGKIQELRTVGFNEDYLLGHKRPIRDDIRKFYKTQPCVVCGLTSSIVTDHKNDLYNDERVLNAATQRFDDFQALCNSCNLKKRQICKKTKETGKRYGATNIPILAVFGIDFIEGYESFDPSDKHSMVGTYWYDPVRFMNHIKLTLLSR